MKTLELFDFSKNKIMVREELKTKARSNDPVTSFASARDVLANKSENCRRVYELLLDHPEGLTDYEISVKTGLLRTSAGKRRKDLGDLVEASGEKRKTDTGAYALVWRLRQVEGE